VHGGRVLLSLAVQARIIGLASRHAGGRARDDDHQNGDGGNSLASTPRLATAEDFLRAETLLRLVVQDMESSLRVLLIQIDGGNSQRVTGRSRIKAESVRPDETLQNLPDKTYDDVPLKVRVGHSGQIVQAMLDYISFHCHRPMALRDIAIHLNMNPDYLSDLFHRTTGVTFHHRLENVRIARAEKLLRDPRSRICEVAGAVGYASPNHFRNVFKAHKGCSPGAWRQSQPPGGSGDSVTDSA